LAKRFKNKHKKSPIVRKGLHEKERFNWGIDPMMQI
jgi:hypothetical protein